MSEPRVSNIKVVPPRDLYAADKAPSAPSTTYRILEDAILSGAPHIALRMLANHWVEDINETDANGVPWYVFPMHTMKNDTVFPETWNDLVKDPSDAWESSKAHAWRREYEKTGKMSGNLFSLSGMNAYLLGTALAAGADPWVSWSLDKKIPYPTNSTTGRTPSLAPSLKRGKTLLALAADWNMSRLVGCLLTHPNVPSVEVLQNHPNFHVVKTRNNGFVNNLPLLSALVQGGDNELGNIQQLLERGINPDVVDSLGKTSLFYAESPKLASLLVQYGADMNHRDNDGGSVADQWFSQVQTAKDRADLFKVLLDTIKKEAPEKAPAMAFSLAISAIRNHAKKTEIRPLLRIGKKGKDLVEDRGVEGKHNCWTHWLLQLGDNTSPPLYLREEIANAYPPGKGEREFLPGCQEADLALFMGVPDIFDSVNRTTKPESYLEKSLKAAMVLMKTPCHTDTAKTMVRAAINFTFRCLLLAELPDAPNRRPLGYSPSSQAEDFCRQEALKWGRWNEVSGQTHDVIRSEGLARKSDDVLLKALSQLSADDNDPLRKLLRESVMNALVAGFSVFTQDVLPKTPAQGASPYSSNAYVPKAGLCSLPGDDLTRIQKGWPSSGTKEAFNMSMIQSMLFARLERLAEAHPESTWSAWPLWAGGWLARKKDNKTELGDIDTIGNAIAAALDRTNAGRLSDAAASWWLEHEQEWNQAMGRLEKSATEGHNAFFEKGAANKTMNKHGVLLGKLRSMMEKQALLKQVQMTEDEAGAPSVRETPRRRLKM